MEPQITADDSKIPRSKDAPSPVRSMCPSPDIARSGWGLWSLRGNSTEKDPREWVTGDEPMTGAQRSYLDTLAREAGEELPANLTKAEASEHIDRLQGASDRVT